MRTPSEADAKLNAIHAELTVLHEALAGLRDTMPKGFAKTSARRYADSVERMLQQIERVVNI